MVLAPSVPPLNPLDLVPEEFRRSQVPVQVITLFDLAEVLRVFDTVYDLIVYYEMRLEYMCRYPVLLAKEKDALVEILGYWDQLWKGSIEEGKKLQEYLVALANAVLNTKLATARGYELWAASKLIDLALRLTEAPAPMGPCGKPVQDSRHETQIRLAESLAEMSRNRRSFYGKRWVEAADEAVATSRTAVRISHSPSRSRSYVLIATPLGTDPADDEISNIALQALHEKGTQSCVALAASAASIRASFESLLEAVVRRESSDLREELILAPKLVFIGPR